MDINSADSTGRVTRSLRKRLTSIDNDTSSRPGTPLPIKLTSIAEISASPSKSTRSTRRNSVSNVSTPVKTPAKRVSSSVISESSETPLAVRSTRRRSVLANDNDEIRHASIQISSKEVLAEEIVQDAEIQTITTRSMSRSPQVENNSTDSSSSKKASTSSDGKHKEMVLNAETVSAKKRKPGPKSRTYGNMDAHDMSDVEVEVSVRDDEIADIKSKPSNEAIVVLTDDESNQNIHEEVVDGHSNPINALPVRKNLFEQQTDKAIDEKKIASHENVDQKIMHGSINDSQKEKIEGEQVVNGHYKNKQDELTAEHNTSQVNNKLGGDNSGENVASDVTKGYTANSDEGKTTDDNKKELSKGSSCDNEEFALSILTNNGLSSEMNKTPETHEILSVSNAAPNDCKDVQKKVDFVHSPSNDSSVKIVYPKTPSSTKTTSNELVPCQQECHIKMCLDDQDSKMAEYNTPVKNDKGAGIQIIHEQSSKSRHGQSSHKSESEQSSVDKVENEIIVETTPIRLKSCEYKEMDVPIKANAENVISHSQDENELKWVNPSAKGETGEGSKLDMVSTNAEDTGDNIENDIDQIQAEKVKLAVSSDDESEIEEDESDCYEEECERKNDYIDDEAVEVENYESGDSMDSEERKEIQMNEIPVDSESIGSHETNDDDSEHLEEENSLNSFIVSDNENMGTSPSNHIEDGEIDEYVIESSRKANKKIYKRIQRHISNSSSSDEVEEEKQEVCRKSGVGTNSPNRKKETLNTADMEKKTVNLKCQEKTSESFSDQNSSNKSCCSVNLDSSKLSDSALRLHNASFSKSEKENNEEKKDISRKEILSNYKHSLRLNKSFRDPNIQVDEPSSENYESCKISESSDHEELKNSLSGESCDKAESQLEEVSHTPKNYVDKGNKNNNSLNLSNNQKSDSVSSENCKVTTEKIECSNSFTVEVTLKDGETENKFANSNSKENALVDSPQIFNDEKDEYGNKDLEYLENKKRQIHLPLGNPLIRSRRQSLALPINPDMEICSSSYVEKDKKRNRKSECVLSNVDLKLSQSFIENIEQLKNEKNMFSAKRKRLSKSFSGPTEEYDHNIADINASHLTKRPKLTEDSSLIESDMASAEQICSRKDFKQISSTPHEKINTNDSFNTRILKRCDEILATANRAKKEAKTSNRKNKTKTVKKSKKKSAVTSSEDSVPVHKILKTVPMKAKEKTKIALSQAFKAAEVILNKPTLNKVSLMEKSSEPDVIETCKTTAIKKKGVKETNQQKEKIENVCSTSAGNFMEFPQTPVKKKKVKYIQLPTGKVSVEPLTPKKSSIQALNGRPFRESPITPCAVGVRVKKMNSSDSVSAIIRAGKRKRCQDESLKDIMGPNAQWTQSGLFKEEVILNRNAASKKKHAKQRQEGNLYSVHQNFKENALSRPGINRSTKQELLIIKERKRAAAQ